ncbi:hypothetical protein CI610_03199 [invertebrate metagenome]|uniref:Transposase n=1 Tax=invertebrate metagenome TaxID=1711999 RepID=A0A2H9T3U0_9ZZZZ
MKKSRYREPQIINILKEVEAGRLVKEVCREYSISDATYNWKAKYDGMDASDIKQLKDLEEENRRLNRCFLTSAWTTEFSRILLKKSGKPNGSP